MQKVKTDPLYKTTDSKTVKNIVLAGFQAFSRAKKLRKMPELSIISGNTALKMPQLSMINGNTALHSAVHTKTII